ncbi:hypothetical protein K504DRAFT_20357 [Pleomassaria siparia CBS 279.74]|uniref:Uncharacterized protein n=1 Tax=Pleomassaria siparia CBS 279.74 TaxID=1314801 RepID=A0A6G1KQP6_9PLEO|nr:hypothetical protein K504DRAFT_20357 [Pleomassaria siparia CBS 279.74]
MMTGQQDNRTTGHFVSWCAHALPPTISLSTIINYSYYYCVSRRERALQVRGCVNSVCLPVCLLACLPFFLLSSLWPKRDFLSLSLSLSLILTHTYTHTHSLSLSAPTLFSFVFPFISFSFSRSAAPERSTQPDGSRPLDVTRVYATIVRSCPALDHAHLLPLYCVQYTLLSPSFSLSMSLTTSGTSRSSPKTCA